jgi:putative ABC transport system permease protein
MIVIYNILKSVEVGAIFALYLLTVSYLALGVHMFKNYLTSAFRNLARNKFFALINIGGLAIGFAACLLIYVFVRHEFSYDNWLSNADNIYKMEVTIPTPGRDPLNFAPIPPGLMPGLENYFDEIEESVFIWPFETVLRSESEKFNERTFFVDPDFFKVIDLPMVYGNREAIIRKDTSLLINERMAKKYFGEESAVGKRLSMEVFNESLGAPENIDFEVAGVFKNIPKNSHMEFEVIGLWNHARFPFFDEGLQACVGHGYVKFKPGVDISNVEARFSEYYLSVAPKDESDIPGYDYRVDRQFNFINVQDVHLFSDKINQIKPIGDVKIVASFGIVAILILIIATINFTNLTTAKALNRSREVSIRKVVGAARGQLIRQFLGESIFTSLLALVLSMALADGVLPFFNAFLNLDLSFNFWNHFSALLAIILLAGLVGILGGVYPAFFISNFKPVKALRSGKVAARGSAGFRQFLVALQFSISIGLIISTLVIYKQTDFARTIELGFEKENKIVLAGISSPQVAAKEETLRREMLSLPGVDNAALVNDPLPLDSHANMRFFVPDQNNGVLFDIDYIFVDVNFLQLFGVEPLAGRLYSEEFPSDLLIVPEDENTPYVRNAIVNEGFLKMAGIASPGEAIGKVLTSENYYGSGRPLNTTIVGVIPDLVLRSLKTRTEQMIFFASSSVLNYMILDIGSENREATVAAIKTTWESIVPDMPLNLSFMQDDYAKLYDSEERSGRIFTVFSLFAILVACLGLLGLASFAADQRTKEIGIRKVLGASIVQIIKLLNWQFLKPVVLANLIAWPIAYFAMKDWLESFVYRIDLTFFPFIIAAGLATIVAAFIVTSQSFHAARRSPIHALQRE